MDRRYPLRTRVAVALAHWILRTFAPEYARALGKLLLAERLRTAQIYARAETEHTLADLRERLLAHQRAEDRPDVDLPW